MMMVALSQVVVAHRKCGCCLHTLMMVPPATVAALEVMATISIVPCVTAMAMLIAALVRFLVTIVVMAMRLVIAEEMGTMVLATQECVGGVGALSHTT